MRLSEIFFQDILEYMQLFHGYIRLLELSVTYLGIEYPVHEIGYTLPGKILQRPRSRLYRIAQHDNALFLCGRFPALVIEIIRIGRIAAFLKILVVKIGGAGRTMVSDDEIPYD